MTPDMVMQSLEMQRTYLYESIQLMPKGSPQRNAAEEHLRQQDAQIERVVEEMKRQGGVL